VEAGHKTMTDDDDGPIKAYKNPDFLKLKVARPLRILAEYLEPENRFEKHEVSDTIVFWGSARIASRDEATNALEAAKKHGGDVAGAERRLAMSRYYEEARELARRLTEWSKGLKDTHRRFVVCTGGGPGIMEAANRGASEAKGINVGLGISLPREEPGNPYITSELSFEFHYFFMRKLWFVYLAKALVVFPGGFGTLDEFFEIMTLIQTRKMEKRMPIVMYGADYWNDIIDFDAMARHGTLDPEDLELFVKTNSVDEAFDYITTELTEHALAVPGGAL
jgi:uncharacterized protein (TIGR00730 family)